MQNHDLQPSVSHLHVESEQKRTVEEKTTPKRGFAAGKERVEVKDVGQRCFQVLQGGFRSQSSPELLRAGPLTKQPLADLLQETELLANASWPKALAVASAAVVEVVVVVAAAESEAVSVVQGLGASQVAAASETLPAAAAVVEAVAGVVAQEPTVAAPWQGVVAAVDGGSKRWVAAAL